MKSEKEILEVLEDNRDGCNECKEGNDYYIYLGWVEALEWVLSNET